MQRRATVIVTVTVALLLGVGAAPWIQMKLSGDTWSRNRPSDARDARLAEERETRGERGLYAFMIERDDGSPVRYDPCAPIHVVVDDRAEPPGAADLVSEAMDAVSAATGLVLVDDGSVGDRDQVRGNGKGQPPPVVITWTDPDEEKDLRGATTGIGGSQTSSDGKWYETGVVLLDTPQLEDLLQERNGDAMVRAVIMHEIAHVVGLDHVDDPVELMYPEALAGVTTFGPGDMRGLAMVGSGGCRSY